MTLRAQVNLTLNATTHEALRERAQEIDAPMGDLADLLLRLGLDKTPVETLRAWADKRRDRKGRYGGGLRNSDRDVLAALEALGTGEWAARAFTPAEIARAAGMPVRVAIDALNRLRVRDRVGGYAGDEVDRWSRPVLSVWWTLEKAPPAEVDHALVDSMLRGIRHALAFQRLEPLARGLIEREIRLSSGWSEGATRIPEAQEKGPWDLEATAAIPWLRDSAQWPYRVARK